MSGVLDDLVGELLTALVPDSLPLPRRLAGCLLLLTVLACVASVVLVAGRRTVIGLAVLGVVAVAWLVAWAVGRART